MSFIGGIKAFLEGWKKIDKPPKWVWKTYHEWERRLSTHPYKRTKHFVGNTFIYRVRHGMGAQGEAPIIGWYKKKRKLKGSTKIIIAKDIARKLAKNPNWDGGTRLYKYKTSYKHQEIEPIINGKPVKHWVQVYTADDSCGDDFIPIFYKEKK